MESTAHNLPAAIMKDKVCLVTGATAGIGQVTATTLAAQGAHVFIGARNKQKAEKVVRNMREQTGNESVDYLLADFSDFDQVRGLVRAFSERSDRLDVLINNAGAFFNKRHSTPLGVEMTLLINHLAPFLLTNLLLGNLRGSAHARILNISSEAHKQGSMDFDDLGFKRGYFGMKAYARSKLANILFTYELARRLGNRAITVNAVHPGHVATDIWKTNFSFLGPFLKGIMKLIALTPEQGADNSIFLAASPDVSAVTGKYFVKREAVDSSPLSYDETIAKRLWDVSANLTSLPPAIHN